MHLLSRNTLLAVLILFATASAVAEPVNPEAKQSVVYLLQIKGQKDPQTGQLSAKAVYLGTGFAATHEVAGKGVQFLVTARHVVTKGDGSILSGVFMQFPGSDGDKPHLQALDDSKWLFHADPDRVDAAIYPGLPESPKLKRVQSALWLDRSTLDKNAISEGDEAFYVGLLPHYPGPPRSISIGGITVSDVVSKLTPITRFARLAFVSETALISGKSLILLDADNMPGHSGSPVFLWATPSRNAGSLVAGGRIFGLYGLVSNVLETGKKLKFSEAGPQPMDFRSSGVTGIVPVELIAEILKTDSARKAFR